MRKLLSVIVVIVICVASVVFIEAEEENMPKPDAAELWNYITQESPYQEWEFWPDHQGMQPGRAPHGPLHKVYVNDRILNSSKPPVQYGAIQVKENYNTAEELQAITVMYKVRDYNSDAGDWFWVKYTPEGKAGPVGKPKGCIGCHGTRANNDFVLVHEFE